MNEMQQFKAMLDRLGVAYEEVDDAKLKRTVITVERTVRRDPQEDVGINVMFMFSDGFLIGLGAHE